MGIGPGGFKVSLFPNSHHGDTHFFSQSDLFQGLPDHGGTCRRSLGNEQLIELTNHMGDDVASVGTASQRLTQHLAQAEDIVTACQSHNVQ